MRHVSDDGAPSDVSWLRLESADCLVEHLPRRPLPGSLTPTPHIFFPFRKSKTLSTCRRSNNQMTSRSNEFQRFLATEFTRMEQNIIDFSNQQDVFCGEFRRSLESEVNLRL